MDHNPLGGILKNQSNVTGCYMSPTADIFMQSGEFNAACVPKSCKVS